MKETQALTGINLQNARNRNRLNTISFTVILFALSLCIYFGAKPKWLIKNASVETTSKPLVWGIAGCGRIAHDFSVALSLTHAQIKAYASGSNLKRRHLRASALAKLFNAIAYDSYEDLAKDPDINIIYVATTNQLHHDVTVLMLTNGKHVLVEKPTALNESQAINMISLAVKSNLFFGTNYWTRQFPVFKKLKEVVQSGLIGEIRIIRGDFGFQAVPLSISSSSHYFDRFFDHKLGGGTLLDLGCYMVQYATLLSPHDTFPTITSQGTIVNQVDLDVSTILTWSENFKATFSISFQRSSPFTLDIIGTHGIVQIKEPANCPISGNCIQGINI
jgi:predicted dehydrogenase